jgi:hypothetical protein
MGAVGVVVILGVSPVAAQQAPAAVAGNADHVAAVKATLQKSVTELQQYEWIETTIISRNGQERSRTQFVCLCGPDGKVQKTALPAGAAREEPIDVAARDAIALVKEYVPPDPARIQAAQSAGRMSVSPPDAAGQVQIVILDYLKPGDELSINVDASSDHINGVTVATFTDAAKKDVVGLRIGFGTFADETIYPAKIRLDVAAQDLAVTIENTGHKHARP